MLVTSSAQLENFRMSRVCSLVFFVACHLLLGSCGQEEERFNPRCPPFECGVLGRTGFPFSNKTNPECGLSLIVDSCNETLQMIQFGKHGPRLFVPNISPDNTLTLQYDNKFESPRSCCNYLKNITIPISPFTSVEEFKQIQFLCPSNTTVPKDFDLNCNDTQRFIIYRNNPKNDSRIPPPNCSFIDFRMNKSKESVEFINLYAGWFRLQVNVTKECLDCNRRGDHCQFDDKGKFLCANETRDGKSKSPVNLVLTLGITAAGIGMLILLAFCFRKMLLSDISMIFVKKRSENCHNIEAFLKIHGSLGPKSYNYSDIKKMTNSFKHKLGQGGFGGVYKGNLLDGRDVAVKVLREAKGSGEEFINKVASISRTSHVNIVTLLGFCFEGNRRALIYEYVPNGSLDKFIYEKSPLETTNKLKWETSYQIAVGIARGLEYLHRGCSTRIFHFDIKPGNILLDKDFCPKISDFGLAKICPQKESVISMTGARGTIGYMAP